jgi:prolyl-tRNA editing enzyme YbaK/EbsC (Cys-tRNA(Pro) deacylase)
MTSALPSHPTAAKVAELLIARGCSGPFREFEASTKTAADAAGALGCEVGQIASSLVFLLDGVPIVILKSGAFRVDTDHFSSLVGGGVLSRASAEDVRTATGQAIGGVSPIGWPGEMSVYIDDSLADYPEVWAACGTPNAVFATSYAQLIDLTNAQPVTLRM